MNTVISAQGLVKTFGATRALDGLDLGGDPWRDAVRLHRRLAYVPGR